MSVYIIYADIICCLYPPVLLEQSGQPPNSYNTEYVAQNILHSSDHSKFAPVEHVSARFLWPVEGATICKDPGSGIEASSFPLQTL